MHRTSGFGTHCIFGHFQIHTEVWRKDSPIPGQLLNIVFGILPNPLKMVIIEEKMYHSVKMVVVL